MGMESATSTLTISYRGKNFEIVFDEGTTLRQLGARVVDATGVSPKTVKILPPGRTSGAKGVAIKPFEDDDTLAVERGVHAGQKLVLVASLPTEVDFVEKAKDDPTVAGFNHEFQVAQRRRRTGGGPVALPTGPYTFHRYQALEHRVLNPPPSEALKLLHRLAADPGIVAVMQKHRWTVGLLSEMPPEGKVGISAMCILGYNVNHGQEISLRLRTDDLKGFRRYDRIRETLCHELAHMVWGEHDNNFKMLNSQLLRESAELDWTHGGYARDAVRDAVTAESSEPDWLEPDDVMAVTAQASGRTLRELAGGVTAAAPPQDPRAADAQGALARLAEATTAAAPSIPPDSAEALEFSPGVADVADSGSIAGLGHQDAATEAKEDAMRRMGSIESPLGGDERGYGDATLGVRDMELGDAIPRAIEMQSGQTKEAPGVQLSFPDSAPMHEESTRENPVLVDAAQGFARDHPANVGQGAAEADMEVDGRGGEMTRVLPCEAEVLPSASDRGADGEGGVLPSAVDRDDVEEAEVLPSTVDEGGVEEAEVLPSGGNNGDEDEATLRYRRAEKAVHRLVSEAGPAAAPIALQTLAKILQNVVMRSGEPKFRRVRTDNPVFQARCGRFPACTDILNVAGFELERAVATGEGESLCLKRNDPGLVWLALSAVNTALG